MPAPNRSLPLLLMGLSLTVAAIAKMVGESHRESLDTKTVGVSGTVNLDAASGGAPLPTGGGNLPQDL